MDFVYEIKESWLGLVDVYSYSEEKYTTNLELDSCIETNESEFPGEFNVEFKLILTEYFDAIKNGEKIINKKLSLFTISLLELNKKDINRLEDFIGNDFECNKFKIKMTKERKRIVKIDFIKLNTEEVMVSEFECLGKYKIEKLDMENSTFLDKIKRIFTDRT